MHLIKNIVFKNTSKFLFYFKTLNSYRTNITIGTFINSARFISPNKKKKNQYLAFNNIICFRFTYSNGFYYEWKHFLTSTNRAPISFLKLIIVSCSTPAVSPSTRPYRSFVPARMLRPRSTWMSGWFVCLLDIFLFLVVLNL